MPRMDGRINQAVPDCKFKRIRVYINYSPRVNHWEDALPSATQTPRTLAARLPSNLGSLTELYDHYLALLGIALDDEPVCEGRRFMQGIDSGCHATTGDLATGHELLAAMATGVFAVTLDRLGYDMAGVRDHCGQFGVRARSLVHPPLEPRPQT
jgi:hypothetical protein